MQYWWGCICILKWWLSISCYSFTRIDYGNFIMKKKDLYKYSDTMKLTTIDDCPTSVYSYLRLKKNNIFNQIQIFSFMRRLKRNICMTSTRWNSMFDKNSFTNNCCCQKFVKRSRTIVSRQLELWDIGNCYCATCQLIATTTGTNEGRNEVVFLVILIWYANNDMAFWTSFCYNISE